MVIDVIDQHEQFERLAGSWHSVYASDPAANFFASWAWLAAWHEVCPNKWQVLAARPQEEAEYVAFLPINLNTIRQFKMNLVREVSLGGYPLADYNGFVCMPGYQDSAVAELAGFVRDHLEWDQLLLTNVRNERLSLFLQHLAPAKRQIIRSDSVACPVVSLPASWDEYLNNSVSAKTRRNIRKLFRQMDETEGFEIVHATKDNKNYLLDSIFDMWQSRWGERSPEHIARIRSIVNSCFERHCLRLFAFFHNDRPVAGLAAYLDFEHKTVYEFLNCFDADFTEVRSPGQAIVAWSLQIAVNEGFQRYDFLRGNEEYKFAFGAVEQQAQSCTIRRKSLLTCLKMSAANL